MSKQLNFSFGHEGWRINSGRKRIRSTGVSHRTREKIGHRTPLHISFKYRTEIRNKFYLRLLKKAILNSRKKGALLPRSISMDHYYI